jgi:hypothetical protein
MPGGSPVMRSAYRCRYAKRVAGDAVGIPMSVWAGG